MMLVSILVVLVGVFATLAAAQNSYMAAVAEHEVFMGTDVDSGEYKLGKNLDLYEGLVSLARSKGVQILVFPEFGLVPAVQNGREALYPFAEKIGNVDNNNVSAAQVPCDHDYFLDKPILRRMSCAARTNGVSVLVNMVDWIDCNSQTDEDCPNDGHYQYNTNVVFDERGRLIVKYHKSHEFPTVRIFTPRKNEICLLY